MTSFRITLSMYVLAGASALGQNAAKPMPADADPAFDVVTIKPGEAAMGHIGFAGRHFSAMNFTVEMLIELCYGLHSSQVVGAPAWFTTERYDFDGVPDIEGVPTRKQQHIMVQKLLASRFQLRFHHEQKQLSVYDITVAKSGPKLTRTTRAPDEPIAFMFHGLGDFTVRNLTIKDFATWFQEGGIVDRPVVDRTGLTDRYDFTLRWTRQTKANFAPIHCHRRATI